MAQGGGLSYVATPPRKVGVLLIVGILCAPWLFSWFLLRQGYSVASRVLAFGWLGFCFLALMISGDQAGRRDENRAPTGSPSVETSTESRDPAPSPIGDGAVYEMTKEEFPKAYAAWGAEWMGKINAMQPGVAAIVAKAPDCTMVESVLLSDEQSVVREKPVFLVDCPDRVRFRVEPEDLERGVPPESLNTQVDALRDHMMIEVCSARVQRQMRYPDTYKQRFTRSGVTRHGWGRATVLIGFDAKNSFGAELPGRAECYVEGDRIQGPDIKD